jgi:acylglycerol lipase
MRSRLASLVLACLLVFSGFPGQCESLRQDNGPLAKELSLPVYEWSAGDHPKAVVVAVHGLIMHGGSYNAVAQELVKENYTVFAPDLRGYGRWYHQMEQRAIDYDRSVEDITRLAEKIRGKYPDTPVFYIGESLGADMVLRLAGARPELVSGLVLSSPAIRGRKTLAIVPSLPAEAAMVSVNYRHKVDMAPYIKRFSSEDPVIRQEILEDPLTRQSLSAFELLRTLRTVRGTLTKAAKIPQNIPVLIIQGNEDRTLRANAVVLLLEKLRCTDQTVKWFPGKGHVLLETAHLQPTILQTVEGWLHQHAHGTSTVSAAEHLVTPAQAN